MGSRTITLRPGYLLDNQEVRNRIFHIDSYSLPISSGYTNEFFAGLSSKVVSPEIDIFSELPKSTFDNTHARKFLNELKRSLVNVEKADLAGITLSKLLVTENSEMTLVIEWIYNYFRVYFSFDKKEGDYYGEVANNPEEGKFINTFNKMDESDYSNVADEEVSFVIRMARGDT